MNIRRLFRRFAAPLGVIAELDALAVVRAPDAITSKAEQTTLQTDFCTKLSGLTQEKFGNGKRHADCFETGQTPRPDQTGMMTLRVVVKVVVGKALAQARRSLAQSDEQKTLWHDAVFR